MSLSTSSTCFFFFFQAEDGIRDLTVTGVQTCALPILASIDDLVFGGWDIFSDDCYAAARTAGVIEPALLEQGRPEQNGRGAGRGRGEISVGAGSFKKKKKKQVGRPIYIKIKKNSQTHD